nr:DivIVA domain-containing protein [Glycomyces salinus]
MASHGDRFRRRALSRGYKVDEVDAFLDRVEATLAGEPVGSPVSADEVDDVVFRVRFGGYDEWQVDVYLDRVARQLAELEERGVLGTAPAPDFGKPESTGSVPAAPPAPQRREPDPAPTQAIPASEMMAAREVPPPPPPPAREPVGRAARAAVEPDPEGFGDLRAGPDDEGFGFLAAPPGDDYEDPFAQRSGANNEFGAQRSGANPEPSAPQYSGASHEYGAQHSAPNLDPGAPRGGPPQEPAPMRGANPEFGPGPGGFGPPSAPEPVPGPAGDFGPPHGGPPPVPDGPQAGSSPNGATQQLPLQSDPRRGAYPPPADQRERGFGPPSAPEPAPGFGAAYDDNLSDTGRRAAVPPPGQSPQPQGPVGRPPEPTGPIPQPPPRPSPPVQQPGMPAGPPPTQAIPQAMPGEPGPQQDQQYGSPRGRGYAPETPSREDTGFGRRAAAPSPPPPPPAGGFVPPPSDNGGFGPPAGGGFGPPANESGGFGSPPSDNGGGYGSAGPDTGGIPVGGDGGGFAPPAPGPQRGAASPPDFGRRNPYEGRGFEAPGRHGREEMTTEMRASDSPFTPDDVQRLEQMRRAFQPRRFGSGYDPAQVDQMFDAVSAAMTGRTPMPLSDRELDTSQFSLVQGGYFEAEVDSALREVREMFARRGMMN